MRANFRQVFGSESDELLDFERIAFYDPEEVWLGTSSSFEAEQALRQGIEKSRSLLSVCLEQVTDFWPDDAATTTGPLEIALRVCDRFHRFETQLRKRPRGRSPFGIKDEYDIQYLMGGLLVVHFDDVIAEDPVPTYAGGASRIDFVLRRERIALEIKMTRGDLGSKEVGEELLIDIARYEAQGGIDTLICLVWDRITTS